MSTTDKLRGAIAPKAAAPTPAAPKRAKTLLDIVMMPSFQAQMKLALPRTLTAERLTRIVMTECRKTPALLSCNRESFLGAVLQCAQLGLEPGGALGHCYLLPFGNGRAKDGKANCQLIIGYRGMLDLARRSGQIVSISAYCVHEKDDFHYCLGLHPSIEHTPSPDADRGPITYVYAVAVLKDGGLQFEVMSRAEVEAVRAQSKAGKSSPWATHFDEMARKTVIRRLFKYLPVSIEAARAVEIDERADMGDAVTQQDFIDAEFVDSGRDASDDLKAAAPVEDIEPAQKSEEPKAEEPKADQKADTKSEKKPSKPVPVTPVMEMDDAWMQAYQNEIDRAR